MNTPASNSKKAEPYVRKLIEVLNSDNKSYIKIFERCQKIVDAVGFPTDDELKRATFAQETMVAAKSMLEKKSK